MPRVSQFRRVLPRALAPAACLLLAGCSSWTPFVNPKQMARDRDLYGPTADQRITELAAEAKAARAAGPAGQAEFTQRLVSEVLGEHDPRVRCRILAAAADFDTPAAVAICKGALQDPDEDVRMQACDVWAKRGGPDAVSLLAARMTADTELDVRLRALRMLGELGDERAIPTLAKALEDPDPAVQYRAVAALKRVSGRDLGDDVNAWRAWAADPEGSRAEWSLAEGFRKLF
ncbi:MAG: HEAT repeat domain-containing protein [Planctomycetaceae bacterium]